MQPQQQYVDPASYAGQAQQMYYAQQQQAPVQYQQQVPMQQYQSMQPGYPGGPAEGATEFQPPEGHFTETPINIKIPGSQKTVAFTLGWRLLFFALGIVTTVVSGLMTVGWLFSLSIFYTIIGAYTTVFGLLICALDFPDQIFPRIQQVLTGYRLITFKHFLFMTRLTGRGFLYIFLGTLLYSMMWDAGAAPLLGLIFATIYVGAGGAAVAVGFKLSMKLEKIRKQLITNLPQAEAMVPPQGLELAQVQDVFTKVDGTYFNNDQMKYILVGLSTIPRTSSILQQHEWREWLQSSRPAML